MTELVPCGFIPWEYDPEGQMAEVERWHAEQEQIMAGTDAAVDILKSRLRAVQVSELPELHHELQRVQEEAQALQERIQAAKNKADSITQALGVLGVDDTECSVDWHEMQDTLSNAML